MNIKTNQQENSDYLEYLRRSKRKKTLLLSLFSKYCKQIPILLIAFYLGLFNTNLSDFGKKISIDLPKTMTEGHEEGLVYKYQKFL